MSETTSESVASESLRVYRNLPSWSSISEGGINYTAEPLKCNPCIRVAKSRDSKPAIILESSDASRKEGGTSLPTRLKHLEVFPQAQCRIHNGGEIVEGRRAIIGCLSADANIQQYFLSVVPSLIDSVLRSTGIQDIGRTVGDIVDLFAALEEPSHKTVQGVWAELLVIALSLDPTRMLAAWRSGVQDKYDFSEGHQRLEVKSTTRGIRIHSFSLEQLSTPADTIVVIASVLVRELVGGSSIRSLVEDIRGRCDDASLAVKMEAVISKTLGASTPQGYELTFDLAYSQDQLRYYLPNTIPAVSSPVPSGVANVRFDSDLTACQCQVPSVLRSMGKLFSVL